MKGLRNSRACLARCLVFGVGFDCAYANAAPAYGATRVKLLWSELGASSHALLQGRQDRLGERRLQTSLVPTFPFLFFSHGAKFFFAPLIFIPFVRPALGLSRLRWQSGHVVVVGLISSLLPSR